MELKLARIYSINFNIIHAYYVKIGEEIFLEVLRKTEQIIGLYHKMMLV